MRAFRPADSSGFSLIEVLVATAIMAVGATALAQLFALAVSANARSRTVTTTVILAQQKMEELLADGAPLAHSPPTALQRNEPGYCEFADGAGLVVACASRRPGRAVFVRRWSVEPLPEDPERSVVLQVAVSASGREARLVGVKTRAGP